MISSILVTLINILIGFWLSPYIIEHIGVEANGYVSLANNFIVYGSIAVTALNSMAGRFITIEYVKKNYKKANLYYNSVFWGNLIIVAVLLPVAICLVAYLDKVINIPPTLSFDVKLLFSFVFLNFFLGTGAPNWEIGTFATNSLARTYVPNIFINLFRCAFLVSIMTIFIPKVWYVGLASSLVTVAGLVVNMYNTHKLTPELHIGLQNGKRMCSWNAIKELVGAGIWNTISRISSVLQGSLDLLICNLFIGPLEMGILAIGKLLPSYISNFTNSMYSAFAPELVINYASGDKNKLKHDLLRNMKVLSFLLSIPICGVIALGETFYKLWIPSQDARVLFVVSTIISVRYVFTSGLFLLDSVFATVNKLKGSSMINLLCGFLSTGIVFVLLKTTNLGIYAIAGVSEFVYLLRINLFVVPFASKHLDIEKMPFYIHEIICVIDVAILCFIGFLIDRFLPIGGWTGFIIKAVMIACVCLVINFWVLLKKEERKIIIGKIRRKKALNKE